MKKFKIVDFSHLRMGNLQDAVNDGWELEKIHTSEVLNGWAFLSKDDVEASCGNGRTSMAGLFGPRTMSKTPVGTGETYPEEVNKHQPVWVNVAPMGEEGWALLSKQKMFLCEIIGYIESEPLKFKNPDLLYGLLSFLDHIQDSAVDDAGIPEHVVFPNSSTEGAQDDG